MWLFGYGSLMWRPGFDHAERQRATLHGRQRAPCACARSTIAARRAGRAS